MLKLLSQELNTQITRYQDKWHFKLLGLLIWCATFTGIPIILDVALPFLEKYFSPQVSCILLEYITIAGITITYNTVMYFIYTGKYQFFEQFRANKKPWPWEEKPEEWKKMFPETVKVGLFILLILLPFLLFIKANSSFYIVMDLSKRNPLSEILIQFGIMYLLQATMFYIAHYTLHLPLFYKRFHKIHHKYSVTFSPVGMDFNIPDFLLENSIPWTIYMKIASFYAPVHITTALSWAFLKILNNHDQHSGYAWPWSPQQLVPFCSYDDYHDFHHSHNVGNFSAQIRIYDVIFGTDKAYKEYKKSLREKSQKAKDN